MLRRILKWAGIAVGGVLALLLIVMTLVYTVSSHHLNKTYAFADSLAIPTDSASVGRGKHVVEAIGKCAACHGDDYSGQKIVDDPVFARIYSTNLTRGRGGIGAIYSDADYVRAIRYGVRPDGKALLFMPSEAFYAMSDSDLGSAIAYLKTIPGVDSDRPASRVGPIARALFLASKFPLIPTEQIDSSRAALRKVPAGETREYGEYLASAGGCRSCHLPSLSGGVPIERVVSANLTPTGIGSWRESDFTKALREGRRPDGRILSAAMPWPYTAKMTDPEIHALWLYIHSLPAKKSREQ
jgi:cytochrome c553